MGLVSKTYNLLRAPYVQPETMHKYGKIKCRLTKHQ